jgi:hypothetical protein
VARPRGRARRERSRRQGWPELDFWALLLASIFATRVDALRIGLRDLGYIENKNIIIEFSRSPSDRSEPGPEGSNPLKQDRARNSRRPCRCCPAEGLPPLYATRRRYTIR